MTPTPSSKPRRHFLQLLFGGSLAALAGVSLAIVGRYLAPIAGEVMSMLAGKISELTDSAPVKFLKLGTKDVMLARFGETVTALDLKCSHAGCTVHWQADTKTFHCPCHGGQYAMDGKVIKGPPPRPLSKLRVAVAADGEITVTDLPA